ncbi:MAG: SPOR domain-containing protein [Syntrophobacterales bacterium]|nr:SPOR domain-containing protein [Syntrophobacterales bacterium]
MDLQNHRRNMTKYYRRGSREDPPFENNNLRRKRTIVFELSLLQSLLLAILFIISFVWMFYFGLTLGRQFPRDENKSSLLHKIAIALGYRHGKKELVAEKSDKEKGSSPGEMQLSLTYHQELSKPASSFPPPPKTKPDTTQKKQRKEELQSHQPSTLATTLPTREDREIIKPETSPITTVESTGEKYTVLVASFKSPENAGRLEQMLKSKGYVVYRQEMVIRNETWYRIMVGSFDNRDSAARFMAMFNEKEGLKGVVVRK